jgi:ADP-ribose pyrophosphatase YjhB (NUDIX family)
MKPDYYYLETDGQIFLVPDRNQWRFPKTRREIPFPFQPLFPIPIDGARVLYGKPILKDHPEHWFHKDAVIGLRNIDPVVQKAVNRSLPRGAAKVAIIERGKVLMVKARRGLTKGIWNLPGGFTGYGEHPEQSARREVIEETGIRVRLIRLVGIYSERFPNTGGYMFSFVYLGRRLNRTIRPEPGEIEAIRWMPLRQAARLTKNPFARAALQDYLKTQPRP